MLYSLATMFHRRCWLGALCLVLAAMLPTYVLGSQMLSNPSNLPDFETLSISASPLLYPSSPPILAFIPTQITGPTRKLTVWVDHTKQAVLRTLYSKPSLMYCRLALRAYRVISASLPKPSPPPSATRTFGGSLSPTRTRTTTIHHPALPEPAHTRLRGRSCTSHPASEPSLKSSSPRSRRRYTILFFPGLARCLRVLYASFALLRRAGTGAARFSASLVQEFCSLDTPMRMVYAFDFFGILYLLKLTSLGVHYRYNLKIEVYQFSNLVLTCERPQSIGCACNDQDLTEWRIWDDMDRDIQSVRMKYALVPGISLKVQVTRERKVRGWYVIIFGRRSADDYHRTDVFETEDELMLAAPDLDCDLELPRQTWDELARDWLGRDPPSPPPSPPQTPSLPQDTFLRPVRIVDPEEPECEGEGEDVL